MAEIEDIFATSDIDNPPVSDSAETAPADEECPCKQTPTDGQRGMLNFGIQNFNDILQNPNAAAISAARQLGGRNSSRLESLIQSASTPSLPGQPPSVLTQALPSISRVQNQLGDINRAVDAFSAECERLSTPEGLLSTISSLSLYSELSCALGIEGVDIGLGLNVVNQNGQFAIQYAVSANVDLEKVLNQVSDGLGTGAADAVGQLQAGLDSAFAKLDEVNSKINEVMNVASEIQGMAADLIQKYTSVQVLADLINQAEIDPCFKLGSTINGGLVSPQFINAVRGAYPSGGSSFR